MPLLAAALALVMVLGYGRRAGTSAAIAADDTPTCPCSMWSDDTVPEVPAFDDTQPVEVGVKFRSQIDGFITALRFYKGSDDPGDYIANLWTDSGTLLASNAVDGDKATGWQVIPFTQPVAIKANVTYVASYHSSIGRYAVTANYFSNGQSGTWPLFALANDDAGGNGVFAYGESSFPNQSFNATSYWVDVVFDTSGVDTVPPAIQRKAPANGATDVEPNAGVKATFTEDVAPASVSFVLRDAGNAVVPAKVAYDPATRTVSLKPDAPLSPGVTYTAAVSGATDTAGNAMPAAISWSFTVAGTAGTAEPGTGSTSPTPTPQIEPQAVTISTDRGPDGFYLPGSTVQVCFTVHPAARVRVTHQRDGGLIAVLYEGSMEGPRCVSEYLRDMISGQHQYVIEAFAGDKVIASATATIELGEVTY
jgi:hypothetical protein